VTDRLSQALGTKGTVALCACLLLGLWVWIEARVHASRSHTYAAAVRQVEEMHADVMALESLRTAPQLVAERERPNDELLAEVRDAMARAKVSPDTWVGNDPNQPVRLPRTPYKRLSTRLSFANINLQDLVSVSFFLVEKNPSLSVSSIRLSAPETDKTKTWNAELTISYLIFSPFQAGGVS